MLGFGILFTGMSLMDTGVSPLRESAAFQELFVSMTNPILGVLVGVVVTVIIQSSSASVGILQALSSTGLVTFGSAIPIILGAHIGTAFTPLLTIGGSSKDGKRTALIHLYFNIIGSVILLAAVYLVRYTIGIPMWSDVMNKSSIANIHTLSSVAAMLLFLPCSSVLSSWRCSRCRTAKKRSRSSVCRCWTSVCSRARLWPCSRPRTRWSRCPAARPAM